MAAAAFTLGAVPALASNGWRATGSLSTPRADHTATLLVDGKVLVTGGLTGLPPVPTPTAELYDPMTGDWSAVSPMGVARSGHTASVLSGPLCLGEAPPAWCGNVLVTGGATDARAELYDPVTKSWRFVGALSHARAGSHTATVLRDGKVLVAGGDKAEDPAMQLDAAELYDPDTEGWAATDSMDDTRSDHTATLLPSGAVLAVAGRSSTPPPEPVSTPPADRVVEWLESAELYDPSTGQWTPAGSLEIARAEHTASLLPDGRTLIAGGELFGTLRRSVEIYDTAAVGGPWVDGGPMNAPRARHSATVLDDGALMVVGGGGGATPVDLASAEVYDPMSRVWAFAPSLATPRRDHTATLLAPPGCGAQCGQLLVAGGRQRTTTILSSAELYGPLPAPPPPAQAQPPGRVADLTASALSSREIRLTFSAPGPADGDGPPAEAYVVKQSRTALNASNFASARALCGGVCRFSPDRAGGQVTLTVKDLYPNRTYHYGVTAMDASGRPGAVSNFASARTARDRIRPGRVRGLAAKALGRGRLRLRFRAPASDRGSGPAVRRFVIKQSTRPLKGKRAYRRARTLCRRFCLLSPRKVGSRLRLTVKGLCAGRRYYYAIRARDEGANLGPVTRFRAVRARGGRACPS